MISISIYPFIDVIMRHVPETIEEQSPDSETLEGDVSNQEQAEFLESLQTEKEAVQKEQEKQKEALEKELIVPETKTVEENKESIVEKEEKPKKKQSRREKIKKLFSFA